MILTTTPFLCKAAACGKYGECLYFKLGSITDALFVYLGGEPEEESVSVLEEQFTGRPLVCLTKPWEHYIRRFHPAARVYQRFMMKPGKAFRFPELQMLPESCTLVMMDDAAFAMHPFSHGINYPSFNAFQAEGSGCVVYHEDEIVASASSFISFNGEIELDVFTKEEYRGNGFAEACISRVLKDCMDREILVHWDAQNDVSRHLAEKFGFELDMEYSVYWLPK